MTVHAEDTIGHDPAPVDTDAGERTATGAAGLVERLEDCLLYTSPSPRDS